MQWSDAAREPRVVAAAIEAEGEVWLERRGEDVPYLVMRGDRVKQARDGMDAAARVFQHLTFVEGGLEKLEGALLEAIAWTRFLPDKDRREFTREFTATVVACTQLEIWTPLGRVLHEWEQTAIIHADPELAARLSRAAEGDFGPVMPPADESEEADGAEEG